MSDGATDTASDGVPEPSAEVLDDTTRDSVEDVDDGDVLAEPLAITDLEVQPNPGSTISFFVVWRTNRPASSRVDFGEDPTYGSTRGFDALVTDHRVLVVGCPPESDIHFEASSIDEGAVTARSGPLVHTTGSLPDVIPTITLDVAAGPLTQPGMTLMNISQVKNASPTVVVTLDSQGRVIWYWVADGEDRFGAVSTQKLDNGDVLVGAAGERPWVQVDLAGDEVYRGAQGPLGEGRIHHHAGRLDDGSTVVVRAWWQPYAWLPDEVFTYDEVLRVDTGTGTALWSWRAIDHLSWPLEVVADWTHVNSVTVDLDAGFAYVNCRGLGVLLKVRIDIGGVVWKLGPCDDCDFALGSGEWFYRPHDPEILPGGRILMYDNGNGRPEGNRSRAVEYAIDEVSMTATQVWEYDGPPGWYTPVWGDADRLENGNTLVAAGARDEGNPSKVFEVTPGGDVVWAISLPDTFGVYRAERIDDLGY